MEKIEIQGFEKIKKILEKDGVADTREYLGKRGYAFYPEIGYVSEHRVDYCIKKGFLVMKEDGFFITEHGAGTSFYGFLCGNTNKIYVD